MKPMAAAILAITLCNFVRAASPTTSPTVDDGTAYLLTTDQRSAGPHHLRHAELFSRDVNGMNLMVLKAIDTVQATALDGGGYFIGIKAKPPESPIGYGLKLFGQPLLEPPRKSSYCSGSSYTAFIEALNLIFPDGASKLSPERMEAMRMQEPDGGRREDRVKFWGHWNDDGFGSQFALVQYAKMGEEIEPQRARPGDFMNISWKSGNGHAVIFLGWQIDDEGKKHVLYWASQPKTNGLGDQLSAVDKISELKIVRLTDVGNLFKFDPQTQVNQKVPGDSPEW